MHQPKHDVAFECVGADDVIIILVLVTPDDAGPLIIFTGNGFELYADVLVFGGEPVEYGERETIARRVGVSLGKDLFLRW